MVPVSGSAYTYTYAVMGEFIAWLVACGLILEYTVASSTVAAGWSGYLVGILKQGGVIIPEFLTKAPSQLCADGTYCAIVNLPAMLVACFIGLLLFIGTKESVMVNRVLVSVKLIVIFIFILVAVPHIKFENYQEFMPYGWKGVFSGSAAIFFAYLGFDAVATTAEECKNPKRDLPIGLIGSLLICAVIYVVVSLCLTGIVNYKTLGNPQPLAQALRDNGSNIGRNWRHCWNVNGFIGDDVWSIAHIFCNFARWLIAKIFLKNSQKTSNAILRNFSGYNFCCLNFRFYSNSHHGRYE